jgi:hypothetical protein
MTDNRFFHTFLRRGVHEFGPSGLGRRRRGRGCSCLCQRLSQVAAAEFLLGPVLFTNVLLGLRVAIVRQRQIPFQVDGLLEFLDSPISHSGFFGDIRECPIAIVALKISLSEVIRHAEIRPAVVVRCSEQGA